MPKMRFGKTILFFFLFILTLLSDFIIETFFFLFCRFCVGDRFFLLENKILCEYDYEERMLFASLPQDSIGKQREVSCQPMTYYDDL